MAAFLVGVLVLTSLGQWRQWQCQGSPIRGRYFNYAEGFSVAIPSGLRGRRGQSAGPERGVSLPLSRDCAGVAVVYGEPNSAEWSKPADAITHEVRAQTEHDPQAEIRRYRTRLGKLTAAGVTVRHRATSDVEDVVVAFRPRGGPVYTARLATTRDRYAQDRKSFRRVLRGFRLEPWR
jgi:hypothetical protein